MAVRFVNSSTPRTEGGLTRALMKHFDWTAKRCYPNVHLFPWESDLLVVGKSFYATEIEIKVDARDWRMDSQKGKWKPHLYKPFIRGRGIQPPQDWNKDRGWDFVKTFFYAVPPQLIAHQPEDLPVWAGILVVDERGRVRTHRPGVMRKGIQPITPEMQDRLHGSMYHRYIRHFMKK